MDNGSNLPLGERTHRALVHAARLKSEADKLEKLAKRVLAQIVIHAEGKSHAEREAHARIDPKYIAAEDAAITAATEANVARANADGMQIKFEAWRTEQSTRRAEMQLR